MDDRKNTISTHAQLKTTVHRYSFNSQVITLRNNRAYVIGGIEHELTDIAPGCKIIDNSDVYHV